MRREQFIRSLFFGAAGLSLLSNSSCNENQVAPKPLPLHQNNAEAGHLTRTALPQDAPLENTTTVDVLIIGGGISGLSAGRSLLKHHLKNFKILELASRVGGNSIGGENEYSKYPFGAHYLPIPGNENTELIKFLEEKKIITGFEKGLPLYDEFALCQDPEERLLDSNYWFEGLIPVHELNSNDKKEILEFFEFTTNCKKLKDQEGKYIFDIPVAYAASASEWDELDKVSFKNYLLEKGYHSKKLMWYLDYCCRDDYGQGIDKVSAYMGIHYFASRRGMGANCNENAVLTWPEGNQHLVDLLHEDLNENITTCAVVRDLNITTTLCFARYTDWNTGKHFGINAKAVIMAVPHHVRKKILPSKFQTDTSLLISHQPWLVATVSIKNFSDKNGYPLSWDNVIMNSDTLGYVFAQHQSIKSDRQVLVFTLYKPLDFESPEKVRALYHKKSEEQIKSEIISDWLKIYLGQKDNIVGIDYALWGHGMCSPGIDYVRNKNRQKLIVPLDNKVFFAHTDDSGISLFEEAFYHGTRAANEILQMLS